MSDQLGHYHGPVHLGHIVDCWIGQQHYNFHAGYLVKNVFKDSRSILEGGCMVVEVGRIFLATKLV